MTQNKNEGWEEEFGRRFPKIYGVNPNGNAGDDFGMVINNEKDEIKSFIKSLLHEREEEMVKSFSDEMRDRILYIGDEIPDSLAKDKRDKFILLGIPDEVINKIIKRK